MSDTENAQPAATVGVRVTGTDIISFVTNPSSGWNLCNKPRTGRCVIMERELNMLFIRVQYTAFLIRPIRPTYTNQLSNFLITNFSRVYGLHAHRLRLQAQISNAIPILLNNENESRRIKNSEPKTRWH